MQSTLSLSTAITTPNSHTAAAAAAASTAFPSHKLVKLPLLNLRCCGLRKQALSFTASSQRVSLPTRRHTSSISAALSTNGTAPKSFDYDLVIIGAGVGGHGAALHAVEKGLKTAIIEGDVMGGTCVNRGCVPSKALLAMSGRMRELQNEHHLKSFGLQVAAASYDRVWLTMQTTLLQKYGGISLIH